MTLTLNTETWWSAALSVVLLVLLAAIPIVGCLAVNRVADRRPSLGQFEKGPRRLGVVIVRVGAALLAVCILAVVVAFLGVTFSGDEESLVSWALIATIGILTAVGFAAVAALGWALSQRAAWVFLALISLLDLEIVLVSVLVELDSETRLSLVALLAFAIHSVCAAVASRWAFTARLHGPVEQAKAGEAGRSIAAVWVFLAAYTAISLGTAEEGIFGSAAGSAVTGALTLGALGATMGSGYTKYVEAMNAGGPRVDPVTAVRPPRPGRIRRWAGAARPAAAAVPDRQAD